MASGSRQIGIHLSGNQRDDVVTNFPGIPRWKQDQNVKTKTKTEASMRPVRGKAEEKCDDDDNDDDDDDGIVPEIVLRQRYCSTAARDSCSLGV